MLHTPFADSSVASGRLHDINVLGKETRADTDLTARAFRFA